MIMEKLMRSFFQHIWAIRMFMLFLLAACGTFPSTATPTLTATSAPSPSPTLTPTLLPTPTLTPLSQAFFCVSVNTPTPAPGCSLPTGQERDRFCTGKAPYTLIAIPVGVSYQVVTPHFSCVDGGVSKGSHLLVCTGPQSYAFQIKVCQPDCAPAAPPLQSGSTGYCAPGFNYDQANQCCQMPAADQNGCVTLKSGTRSCGG